MTTPHERMKKAAADLQDALKSCEPNGVSLWRNGVDNGNIDVYTLGVMRSALRRATTALDEFEDAMASARREAREQDK